METRMVDCYLLRCCILIFFAIQCQSIIENDSRNDDIDITQAPFALSLRLNNDHVCGATIISEMWGITAAHCLPDENSVYSYSVRSGSTYRLKGGSIHNMTKIMKHEKYNIENSDYDIAVFSVDPPFDFDSMTQSIELPENSTKTDYGFAIGWGAFSSSEDILSDNLKAVKLPRVEKEECIEDYAGFFELTPRQECYGYRQGGIDTCKGDSGGPLYNFDKIMIGITSWGDGCAAQYSPGVYTNVKMFTNWIQEHADV